MNVLINGITKKSIHLVCIGVMLGVIMLLQVARVSLAGRPTKSMPVVLFEVHVVGHDPATSAAHTYWKIAVLISAEFIAIYEHPTVPFREQSKGPIDRKTMDALQTLLTRRPADFSLHENIPIYRHYADNWRKETPQEIERLEASAYASQLDVD